MILEQKTGGITSRIRKVAEHFLNTKSEIVLNDELKQVQPLVQEIAEFLDVSVTQAALFSVYFFQTVNDNCLTFRGIAEFMKCNVFDVLEHSEEIRDLAKKGLLNSGEGRRRHSEVRYHVPSGVIESINRNEVPKNPIKGFTIFSLADKIESLFETIRFDVQNHAECLNTIDALLEANPELSICKMVKDLKLKRADKYFFVYIFAVMAKGEQWIETERAISISADVVQEKIFLRKCFLSGKSSLLESGVLEYLQENFKSNKFIRISEKTCRVIFGDDYFHLFLKKEDFRPSNIDMTSPDKITRKELFYNPEEVKSIDTLTDLLQPKRYRQIIESLKENNMGEGLIVLLHGSPGTGKTETVYQLARKANRTVLSVDISKIRDKFVGESEKRIKEIFETYRDACKQFEEIPILLFNESDALIGKRINVTSSVDQMNNSMQNILLQEMENFKGILFATTNLTGNLDEAFERRFLFKVKFSKPSAQATAKIWLSKIATLAETDAMVLAKEFNFSGGQIENIARKAYLDKVLYGRNCTLNELCEICSEETLGKSASRRKIGYSSDRPDEGMC